MLPIISKITESLTSMPKQAGARLKAFLKGVKGGIESKKSGVINRLKAGIEAYKNELNILLGMEDKTKKKATEAVKKNYDETYKETLEDVALGKNLDPEVKADAESAVAIAVTSFKEQDTAHQGYVSSAMSKFKEASAKGKDAEKLTLEEAGAVTGVAFLTLRRLKDTCKTEKEFTKKIQNLKGAIGGSGLSKILNAKAFMAFKMVNPDTLNPLKIVGLLSFKNEAAKFLSPFGVKDGDELLVAGGELGGLSKNPMENKSDVVNALKRYFFKDDSTNVGVVADTINEMITSGGKVTPENFAKLTFSIGNKDYDRLILLLTGQKYTPLVQLDKVAKAA